MVTVALLGPVLVTTSGGPAAVTAPMQRAILAHLALAHGHAGNIDQLIDALWADPPARAVNNVQQYISALRRTLGPDAILTTGHGYKLAVEPDGVDASNVRRLLVAATASRNTGDATTAATLVAEALALHRGEPLADLPDSPFVEPVRAGLEGMLLEARLLAAGVENDLGHFGAALERTEALAAAHPLDENVAVERMRALAGAGRQAEALAVYEWTRVRLDDELGLEPGAALRGAQAAVLNQDPTFAPVPARGGVDWDWLADTIPNPPTMLVGRADALTAAEDTLARDDTRLVTVLGSGGIGKTRLAIEVARRQQRQGRTVAYVALDRIASAEQVLPTIAAALRVKESAETDLVTRVSRTVHATNLLLVLDNFEHVVSASTGVAQLVASTESGVQVLVTSREALRVSGEHLLRLDPLATHPDGGGIGSGDGSGDGRGDGEGSPASELFWQRAQSVNPSLRRDGDRVVVEAICRRLDGLPLAIELAAARVTLMPPAALLEKLSDGLGLLSSGTRDAPDRQQSLRACLEWSVGLLTDEERRLFACLSVFPGGATFPAVDAVASGVLADADTFTIVDSLVSKSLLTVTQGPTASRLRMLETVREYAAELFEASGDKGAVHEAHALHYHRLYAAEASILNWPPRNAEEAAVLNEELPNARVAAATLRGSGQYDLYAGLVVALCRTFSLLGAVTEVAAHITPLLAWPELHPSRRIELLYHDSYVRMQTGDLVRSRAVLDQAISLLREHPDDLQEALVLLSAAWLDTVEGRMADGRRHCELAQDAARRSGNLEVAANVDGCLLMGGYRPGILAASEAALAVAREQRNQIVERVVLINLGEMALISASPDVLARALGWGADALEVALALGDLDSAACARGNRGGCALLLGDIERARTELLRSMEMARRSSNVALQIENLLRLAAVEAATGNRARAHVYLRYWRTLAAEYGIALSESNANIVATCLPDNAYSLTESVDEPGEGVSLQTAVAVALGELPLPDLDHGARTP